MTTQQNTRQHDAGITDVIGSMMDLATAGTRFTWRQMQNAMGLCVGSQSAMNNVRDSLCDLSHAMSRAKADEMSTGSGNGHSTEPKPAGETFTGRKV